MMTTRTTGVTRMLAMTALALPLALQTAGPNPVREADAAPEPAAEAPGVERYAGTLAEGLAEVEALTAKDRHGEALALAEALLAPTDFTRWRRELEQEGSKVLLPALELADPLLEAFGLNGYPEPLRAEVHYAEGLVRRDEGARAEAEDAFGRAIALAGPGTLRLEAMYNRGQTALEEGEEWRAEIPEISGQPPQAAPVQPPPSPMGGAAAQPQAEEPDPLAEARKSYLRAREHLTLRLRADWRDEDTRANVELIQRRLKELDEIERQREEQQEEQQQQDEQQEDQEQQQDQQQPGENEEQQDPEQQGEEEEQQQDQPEQPPQSDEQQEEQEQQPEQQEGEAEEPQEQEQPEEEREAEPQEIYLTREEVQRLLQQLREHEEEGETVRERLHRDMQRRVERDW